MDERMTFIGGPDSGCAVDYWLKHARSGKKAYVNDNQGHVKVNCELVG